MSRVPIRVRLAAAFAAAMVIVLAVAGAFVYTRLEDDVDESVDATLSARAQAVSALGGVRGLADEPDEAFAQVVAPEGRVLARTGGAGGRVLTREEASVASRRRLVVERRVAGIDGTARILALPAPGGGATVVGQSLEDRDETLGGVIASFALGGPVAVLIASLLGYALARGALAPVDAMRRRAEAVSLRGDEATLPLPAAHDEVRRLGETLNEMLARLRRSFDRERRFVADASHELRTPVAVVKTEIEALLRRPDLTPDVRAALVGAGEEADHLAHLAEDLLILARAGEGRLAVRPERLPAARVLDDARRRFADRAGEHGRRLAVDAPDAVEVTADPLLLRQALGNLVDNALRHGAGDVTLSAQPAGDGVELAVEDRGGGFAPGFAARAFERFTRGDDARTRGGTGLGLAIVRTIVEAHGGRVAIAGARVTLWLPSQAHLSDSNHDAPGTIEPPLRGGTR